MMDGMLIDKCALTKCSQGQICCIGDHLRSSCAKSHSPKNLNADCFQMSSFLMPNFKCNSKLAHDSNQPTPPNSLSLSVFSCVTLSCACCHGDMTRKQRRSDETEWRGLEVAVAEAELPNKTQLQQPNCWMFCCKASAEFIRHRGSSLDLSFLAFDATSFMVIP